MQRARPAQHSAMNRLVSALTRNSFSKIINNDAELNQTVHFTPFHQPLSRVSYSRQRTYAHHSGQHTLSAQALAWLHICAYCAKCTDFWCIMCLVFTWKALSSTAGLRFSIMTCPTCTCSARHQFQKPGRA